MYLMAGRIALNERCIHTKTGLNYIMATFW